MTQGCFNRYPSETVSLTDRLLQTWDAFDFFTVSLTASDLAETFDKSVADITWGITLVLMFRSVGSILFGIAADRYGRKWPFVVNNLLFMVLELVSVYLSTCTFCQDLPRWIGSSQLLARMWSMPRGPVTLGQESLSSRPPWHSFSNALSWNSNTDYSN